MFRNLLSYHRGIKFARIELTEAARYGLIFLLPYEHEWTLSYTYRVLISPIDKSSEQRKNKTKQNTKICHAVKSATSRCTRGWSQASSRPRRGVGMPCLSVGLRCCIGSLHRSVGPRNLPRFLMFSPFFQKSNSKTQNNP